MGHKILFTGGGTAGSVAPLIAIKDELENLRKGYEFVWLGTKAGPERAMVEGEAVKFIPIISGKLRRYWSLKNITDLFRIAAAFFQSLLILKKEKPALVLSAGSFVSVPVVWAARCLGIPALIHQQDVRPGLANRLMASFARTVTVTFEKSLKDYGPKAVWVGNSVRDEFRTVQVTPREARLKLSLNNALPVVLIMGGGTGAKAVNALVEGSLERLSRFCQVIHVAGQGKLSAAAKNAAINNPNYRPFEFLDTFGIIKAYTAADAVVSRCGMSALTEISFLGKPAILIPLPDSHQEENALVFAEQKAAIVLDEKALDAEVFANHVKELLTNETMQRDLKDAVRWVVRHDGQREIAAICEKLIKNSKS